MDSKRLLVLVAFVVSTSPAAAQDSVKKPAFRVPRESPGASVRQEVGLASVEIAYARPALKGRDLSADLAALKTPWRFGANAATTLKLTAPAKIAGKDVAAGTYALFARPGTETWTLLLNSKAEQWGAYFHDPTKDVLAFEAKPGVAPLQERLSFTIDLRGTDTATIEFRWGTVRVAFDVTFDVLGLEDAQIADALEDLGDRDWAVRLQIAQTWIKRGSKIPEALALLNEAEAINPSFWIFEWKARGLHAQGKTAEAIPLLEKAAEVSRGKAPGEYGDNLVKLAAEWKAAAK
jgi:hypothetical protein